MRKRETEQVGGGQTLGKSVVWGNAGRRKGRVVPIKKKELRYGKKGSERGYGATAEILILHGRKKNTVPESPVHPQKKKGDQCSVKEKKRPAGEEIGGTSFKNPSSGEEGGSE